MATDITKNIDVHNYDALFLTGLTAPTPNLWYKLVTAELESDSLSDVLIGSRVVAKMAPFGYGACRGDNLPNPYRYMITKQPFENHVTFNLDEYESDTLGAFDKNVLELGKAAQRDPNYKIADLIAANGTAYDGAAFFGPHTVGVDTTGKPMFATTNGVSVANPAAGTAVTYTNILTATNVPSLNVSSTNKVPTNVEAANIIAALTGYFLTMPDWSNNQINEDMQEITIIVGDALKYASFVSASSAVSYVAPGISNPVAGLIEGGFKINVKLLPAFAGDAIYAFRTDAPVPAFVKTEKSAGIRTSFQGYGSDYQLSCNSVRYNAQVDRGFGYGAPSSAIKATISHT